MRHLSDFERIRVSCENDQKISPGNAGVNTYRFLVGGAIAMRFTNAY